MINKVVCTIVLCTLALTSCISKLPNIQLGDRLPKDAIRDTNVYEDRTVNVSIMVSPSEFQDSYTWKYKNTEYTLGVDKSGYIQYISTKDTEVETNEGIKVGQTLAEARKIYEFEIEEWTGWGYVGYLPSGWKVAFFIPSTMTSRELYKDDKIKIIFKGSLAGYGVRRPLYKLKYLFENIKNLLNKE